MGKRENDKLRWLLRRYEPETPSPEFTAEVIKEIKELSQERVRADDLFKQTLQKNIAPEPSAGFTYKVINKTRERSPLHYPPVITKKAWIVVCVFLIICLIAASGMEGDGSGAVNFSFDVPLEYMGDISRLNKEPLFYCSVSVISAFLLLALDNMFTNRSRRRHNG